MYYQLMWDKIFKHYPIFRADSLWKYFAWAAFFSTLLMLAIYLLSQLGATSVAIPGSSLILEILFDLIILILAIKVSVSIPSKWRFVFMLITVEAISQLLIAIKLMGVFIHQPNILIHLSQLPTSAIESIYYSIRPFYIGLFFIMAFIQVKPNFRMLAPTLPTVVTILLVMACITWPYHQHHLVRYLPFWQFITALQDMLLVLFLIYCLPIAKNKAIQLFTTAYLLITIANIFGERLAYAIPYFTTVRPGVFFWISGNILLICALFSLSKKENTKSNDWFYPVNNTHAQISYWSNSIVSLLFLLIISRYFVLLPAVHATQLIFYMNFSGYILFISLLSILTPIFAQLFSHDFTIIRQLSTSVPKKNKASIMKNEKMFFKETHELAKFLKFQITSFAKQQAYESKLFNLTKEISYNFEKPLGSLAKLSQDIEVTLTENQRNIYKSALNQIEKISEDFLVLERSAQHPHEPSKSCDKHLHLGIIFQKIINEKKLQYKAEDLTIATEITEETRTSVSNINETDFYRVCSNLINNAVEATQKSKEITCSLNLDNVEEYFILTITDNGIGMSKKQINSILKGKSKSTKHHGYGLGLRYVIDKVREWRGQCIIDSTIGQGTRFQIYIPTNIESNKKQNND